MVNNAESNRELRATNAFATLLLPSHKHLGVMKSIHHSFYCKPIMINFLIDNIPTAMDLSDIGKINRARFVQPEKCNSSETYHGDGFAPQSGHNRTLWFPAFSDPLHNTHVYTLFALSVCCHCSLTCKKSSGSVIYLQGQISQIKIYHMILEIEIRHDKRDVGGDINQYVEQ